MRSIVSKKPSIAYSSDLKRQRNYDVDFDTSHRSDERRSRSRRNNCRYDYIFANKCRLNHIGRHKLAFAVSPNRLAGTCVSIDVVKPKCAKLPNRLTPVPVKSIRKVGLFQRSIFWWRQPHHYLTVSTIRIGSPYLAAANTFSSFLLMSVHLQGVCPLFRHR